MSDESKAGERLARRARELFDDSVADLDAGTRSRLTRGRHAALESARRTSLRWTQWVPAAGVAAVATMAVLVWHGNGAVETGMRAATPTDLELMMDQESFEMLEDLEFYSWMQLEAEGHGESRENVG